MPDENVSFLPLSKHMQLNEIDFIVNEFVALGVNKVRLTGGEPLLRMDAKEIILNLSKFPVKLTLTTNGSLVHKYIEVFKEAGVKSLNFSLDTLDGNKFRKITKRNSFERVRKNIHLFIEKGFHVKVNAVIMRGVNENEIPDFIEWTKNLPVHVRFIEFMPFAGNRWTDETVFSFREILELVNSRFNIYKLKDDINDTAKKFKVLNYEGSFAVISTMSSPFCVSCNRMRLTADGKMKNCLFSKNEFDILGTLRKGEDIKPLVRHCISVKEESLGGQFTSEFESIDASKINNRSMVNIGG